MITNGTEKQIAWATEIRATQLAKWDALIADLETAERARNKMLAAIIRKIIDVVSQCDDAATWIDGRDNVSIMLNCMGKKDAAPFGTDARELRNVLVMMR